MTQQGMTQGGRSVPPSGREIGKENDLVPAIDSAGRQWKILVIAGMRFPIREPFVGGLEAHTWHLVHGLRQRGHFVQVAGADGSDPDMAAHTYGEFSASAAGERLDISESPGIAAAERAAFEAMLTDLRQGMLGTFDVVHNNSLYHAPIRQADSLPCPMVTTFHTPVLPWAASVFGPPHTARGRFIAVSAATAASWRPFVRPQVIPNGVDMNRWPAGPGGTGAVWSGRLAPEKGAHLAADIAERAGLRLTLAGPIIDQGYFASMIAPRLGETVRYAGHLAQAELAALVGSSAVALVTPVWEEPFGLVAAEAGASGTPVVAFRCGGLPGIVTTASGRLVPRPRSSAALTDAELNASTAAVREATALDRTVIRETTALRFGLSAMIRAYEDVYQDAINDVLWR